MAGASGESTWNFSQKNQNHRGNKEFVPHVRFPSSSCSVRSSPSAEVEVEPTGPRHHSPRPTGRVSTNSGLASPPARCQQPVSHTPRKAAVSSRLVRRRRGIHESSPRTRKGTEGSQPKYPTQPRRSGTYRATKRLPFVSYHHYQPGRACHRATRQQAHGTATAMHATLLHCCYCR